ncbi:MAG: hypothetical protein M3Q51_01915 [Pseudomonadota bacterium]|nr:hypothetical protein [Pseudomonadota bacterium]
MSRFLIVCLLLCACSNPNENKFTFKDRQDFALNGSTLSGWVPQEIVFASAKNIRVTTNVDLNVVRADFLIDRSEISRIPSGFFPIEGSRLNRLISGAVLQPMPDDAVLAGRCSGDSVEFLMIKKSGKAAYWNSRLQEARKMVCNPRKGGK